MSKQLKQHRQSYRICASCGEHYLWIIDRDHIADTKAEAGTNDNAVGINSGGVIPPMKEWFVALSKPFVMKDDDGISYYTGKLWGGCGFEPLDDFGMPNAGATEIWIDGKLL